MYFTNVSKNFISGILVAILAIPLSMGISIASSFPIEAGLITSIVLGITASLTGSQKQSIKGPAAGLISIMTAGMLEFDHQGLSNIEAYRCMLAAGLLCGFFQIVAAKLKWTKQLQFVPPSVLHGLLAGIGGIIFIKQFPILVGSQIKSAGSWEFITHFASITSHANLLASFIGLSSIILLSTLEIFPQHWMKRINLSPPLLLFLITVTTSLFIDFVTPRVIHLGSYFDLLVSPNLHVPMSDGLLQNMSYPNVSALTSFSVWKWGMVLFLIGSIESTMTIAALQSATPSSKDLPIDSNKDLSSLGFGNILASIFGGLPGISEVARTKANIEYGATSSVSLFVHSIVILGACVFGSSLLAKMPMPILSAMLIMVAYKLIAPAAIRKSYQEGWDQLALYLCAMLLTLFTDLMLALALTLLLKIFIHLTRGVKVRDFFQNHFDLEINPDGNAVVRVRGPLIFSNVSKFLISLDNLVNEFPQVFIDLSNSTWVDHTASVKIKNKTKAIPNLQFLES